ncbi:MULTISPECIES: helix-turn-helix domain-containing protein [Arsenicicoccus]|uniref:helix-turn-helix domain-containing protein n=1 Tax=Arsenicicoccus TaxID=267408 RepID=UPI002580B9E7|nr:MULTISPECIES: helix-turn-helix domain-containing protein [Arsenicicoccus]
MTTNPTATATTIANRYTVTVREAAQVLGIGRDVCYRAVRAGQIPSLRLGRRIVVPVAPLLGMLGVSPHEMSEPGSATEPGTATTNALKALQDPMTSTQGSHDGHHHDHRR